MNITGVVTLCVLKFGRFDHHSLQYSIISHFIYRLTDGVITLPELIHPQPQASQNVCDEWFTIENLSDKALKLALEVEAFPQFADLIALEVLSSFNTRLVHYSYPIKGFAQNIEYTNPILFTTTP